MDGKNVIIATHTSPDLDAVAGIWFFLQANPQLKNKHQVMFLSGGDEKLENIGNIVAIDRGRGELDHHDFLSQETAAGKVAKKFGLDKIPENQKLLEIVKENDISGKTKILSIGDLIKRLAHNKKLSDAEKLRISLRLIEDSIEFYKRGLTRDYQFAKELYEQIRKCKFLGYEVRNYFERQKENFQRPFDLVEILTADKAMNGKEEAFKFAKELMSLISVSEENYKRASKGLEEAQIIFVGKDQFIVVIGPDNPEVNNPALNKFARSKGASVVVQRNDDGCQIFFNFKKVKVEEVDMIMAVIRFLEQVFQKKKRVNTDFIYLSDPGKKKEIPEWYYFVSSDKNNGGRFILNKSLTANDPEEIPETQIPLQDMVQAIKMVLIMGEKFSFKVFVHKTLQGYRSKA